MILFGKKTLTFSLSVIRVYEGKERNFRWIVASWGRGILVG